MRYKIDPRPIHFKKPRRTRIFLSPKKKFIRDDLHNICRTYARE